GHNFSLDEGLAPDGGRRRGSRVAPTCRVSEQGLTLLTRGAANPSSCGACREEFFSRAPRPQVAARNLRIRPVATRVPLVTGRMTARALAATTTHASPWKGRRDRMDAATTGRARRFG